GARPAAGPPGSGHRRTAPAPIGPGWGPAARPRPASRLRTRRSLSPACAANCSCDRHARWRLARRSAPNEPPDGSEALTSCSMSPPLAAGDEGTRADGGSTSAGLAGAGVHLRRGLGELDNVLIVGADRRRNGPAPPLAPGPAP